MKQRLQGLIAGIAIGAVLTGSAALSANTTTWYDVLANGIKIVIDGVTIKPKDANGNTVEPIIYNGTTYLPVRAVANALGMEVYWDGPNYTVYLGDMNGTLEYPTVQIEDMVSIADTPVTTDELTDNYGNRYNRAVNNITTSFEYLLNMKYSRFKGTLYIPKGETYDGGYYLSIIADGKTIYTSPEMTKSSAPVYIDVDITGYNDLKIEFSESCWGWAARTKLAMCLGDAGFYQ